MKARSYTRAAAVLFMVGAVPLLASFPPNPIVLVVAIVDLGVTLAKPGCALLTDSGVPAELTREIALY